MGANKIKSVVVGGAGFIGSHLVDTLILRGYEVVVIDNLYSGSLENFSFIKNSNRLKFYEKDFTDIIEMKKIFKAEKPHTVFNLATTGLLNSLKNPEWCFLQEVLFAKIACELLRENYFERLVQFSSSEVYGNVDMPVSDYTRKYRPTTPYAAGKLAADHFIEVMIDLYQIEAVIIRPFNTFGIRQKKGFEGIIPKAIEAMLKKEPVIIYGDGNQTRDFILVSDLLDRMFQILGYHFSRKDSLHNLYLVCSEIETSIFELVKRIGELGNFPLTIKFEKARSGEVRRLVGEPSVIDRKLVLRSLDESISLLIKMLKKSTTHD